MSTSSPSSQHTPSTPGDAPPSAGPNNDQFRVIRRRNRVPLSCAPCRARKLKCNRSTPCENCVKRGESATCSYAAPSTRKKTGSRSQPSGTPDDMQNRIDKLEGLVLSLMGSGNDPAPPATARTMSISTSSNSQTPYTPQSSEDVHRDTDSVESETEKVAKSFGVLHFNNNQSSYIGDAHWATILHEISEVKNYFQEHRKQYEDALRTVEATRKQAGVQSNGPVFLMAGHSPPDYKDLVNRLPRRNEVDQLVQRYLSDYDPGMSVLHIPSWKRRYEQYWQNPNNSDAAFLAQLYVICGLAMQSYFKNQDEPYEYQGRAQGLAAMYRGLTQQCLQLVDYTKIEQTTIETLTLHLYAEYQKIGEADIGLWVLSRMTISLAMRTGIHRDGKNFPSITPFQCEMRRRQWTFLKMIDTVWSFTVALPTMIKEVDTDTELPSNLRDEDFDEDTEVLPPSRPRTEITNIAYLIAKAELTAVFSKIVAATTGTGKISYDEIVQLNNEIRDLYHGTFPAFHMDGPEDYSLPRMDTLTVMRLNLSITYNKALCVLHRRFLPRSRENIRYAPSRQACVDAALTLLRNQQIVDKESRAGNPTFRLITSTSSVMTHDFILAATLVALDLLASWQAEAAGQESGDIEVWGADRKEEQMQALEGARSIWNGLRNQFVEAYKAYSICGVMIQKVQQCQQQVSARQAVQGASPYGIGNSMNGPTNASKPEHTAAITLGMLSNGTARNDNLNPAQMNGQMDPMSTGMTPNFQMDVSGTNAFPFFSGTGGDATASMDWNAWDEYMQNPNLDASLGNEMWPQGFDFASSSNFDPNQMTSGMPSTQTQQVDTNMFTNPSNGLPTDSTL